MTQFSDLGLSPSLLKAIEAEGYSTPTPIQAAAIPAVIEGRDLLGIAQTGTGKTAAFALPILHRLALARKPAERRHARALILSPTRELASQIGDSFRTYGRHAGLSVAVVFGGVGHRPQAAQLQRGVDILVATPGRLLDHMSERNISLETTEVFVLDEADQMLDLGFIVPIRKIVRDLPKVRQSLFFSATMPHEIGALAAELLHNPQRVEVTPVAKTADRVEQKILFVETSRKRSLLTELFADPSLSRTLVFTRTKRGADRVARHLEEAGVPVAAIHGNKSQGQRERALADFKAGKIRGLVATDIAARGIDVDLVSHVVNFELPNIPESYVHRIGRTARAGSAGIAISLVDAEERAYLRDIERLIRQQIPSEDRRSDPSLAETATGHGGEARHGRDKRNGHQGGRKAGHGQRGGPRRAQGSDANERPAHAARGDRQDGQDRRDRTDRQHRPHRQDHRGSEDRDQRPERREREGAERHRDAARPSHGQRRTERGHGASQNGKGDGHAPRGHRDGRPAAHAANGHSDHRPQRDHRRQDGRQDGAQRPAHAGHRGNGQDAGHGRDLSGVGFLSGQRGDRKGQRPQENGGGKGAPGANRHGRDHRPKHAGGGQHGLRRPSSRPSGDGARGPGRSSRAG